MKKNIRGLACLSFAFTLLAGGSPTAQTLDTGDAAAIKMDGGSVSFEVATNMFGTMVRGKSTALRGATRLRDNGSGLRLDHLEAALPVASLRTGIRLRDEHMRKYIFQTADGQVPDIQFSADRVDCSPATSDGIYACETSGALAIRGTSRPFTIALKVTRDGEAFRVTGDGRVALSMYGIERPSQFGVTTGDEIKIHLECSARKAALTTARAR
jgi:polyisoprenoid-binding protein YceI